MRNIFVIILVLITIICSLLICLVPNIRENFQDANLISIADQITDTDNNFSGFHRNVYPNRPSDYLISGSEPHRPLCIEKCIIDHIPRVKWDYRGDETPSRNILDWNRENNNITKGYCFNAHTGTSPVCDGECASTHCGKITDTWQADGSHDYNHCEIENSKCVEKGLNMTSGDAIVNITGCKECIDKYWPNINVLNEVATPQAQDAETSGCPTTQSVSDRPR